MSFDQLSSLEAQQRRGDNGRGYVDDPDFQRVSQDINNKLFKVNGNISRLSTEISHLGTRRDTARVRERVHDLLEESREIFRQLGEAVKKLQSWEDVTPTQKYTQQKASREVQASLQEFQSLQRKALEKQRASVSAAKAVTDEDGVTRSTGEEGQYLEQQQQQEVLRLAPQDEVDFQEALIIEREEEIRNIEQGVNDLNVLFSQVAQIVSEQGEQLDTIVDNVENVRTDTRGADYELRSAARYQKNARSKACCLLLILSVILTIVLLAIFLG